MVPQMCSAVKQAGLYAWWGQGSPTQQRLITQQRRGRCLHRQMPYRRQNTLPWDVQCLLSARTTCPSWVSWPTGTSLGQTEAAINRFCWELAFSAGSQAPAAAKQPAHTSTRADSDGLVPTTVHAQPQHTGQNQPIRVDQQVSYPTMPIIPTPTQPQATQAEPAPLPALMHPAQQPCTQVQQNYKRCDKQI